MLESIYTNYSGDRNSEEYKNLETYLKRVWFSNGIHFHYDCDNFIPVFTTEYLKAVVLPLDPSTLPLWDGKGICFLIRFGRRYEAIYYEKL